MNMWPSVRIKDIARVEIGGTPTRDQPRYWASGSEGYPWLSIADLSTKWVDVTAESITAQGIRHSNAKLIPAGTVVMSFKLSIGKIAITTRDMYSNEAIAAFYVDEEHVKPAWLYYALPRAASQTVTDIAIKGATLNKSKLRQMETVLPLPVEQTKIADVLSLIDAATRATELLVEKLKLAKQGLLHNLLTRGIDDNGELRDPIRNPEQFKDSSLGLIPRTWELHPLHSCLVGSPTNGLYKPAREIGRGTILVGQTSFTDDYLVDWTAVRRANVSLAEKSYYGLREGDILVSRVFATVAGVGLPVLVANMIEDAVFESNMMRLRANPQQVMVRFLLEALLSHTTRRFISAGANASNQASVNQQVLNAIPLLLPPPAEQIRILSIVEEAERRLHQETVSASKLRLIKQGLAEDLLTGRVRVTPLIEKDSSP
jgi:type I restriction enzyme S subunit